MVRHILSYVPADARARAALVCRAWRGTVADPLPWTVLDLSPASGVAQPVSDATLRGAAALARGGLTVLCLDDCGALTQEARLEVVTENAGSLRELSCVSVVDISGANVLELAGAVPQLAAFKVDMDDVSVADATRMLRNEAPFGALQLRRLCAQGPDNDDGDAPLDEADVLAFCSALSAHTSLMELVVEFVPLRTAAVMDALSAAAVACKLLDLELDGCHLSSPLVPALARLIGGGVLKSLSIRNNWDRLLDEAVAAELANAVATSRTLTRLKLHGVQFWDEAAAAAAVMCALTGHPRMQEVDLCLNNTVRQFEAGAALGALVAANTPALTALSLSHSTLGDAGLSLLFHLLPHNRHLRELHVRSTGMSREFAGHTLLPSVRANTSLRKLEVGTFGWGVGPGAQAPPEIREAEALVEARNNGDR